jgi:hypothetical protein
MHNEYPIMAAGALTIAAGTVKDRKFPDNGAASLAATALLVLLAAATNSTKAAPLIRALSLLYLLGVSFAAVPILTQGRKSRG